jgi:uncharacterized protein involved in exopolysaccharide biosynthesis
MHDKQLQQMTEKPAAQSPETSSHCPEETTSDTFPQRNRQTAAEPGSDPLVILLFFIRRSVPYAALTAIATGTLAFGLSFLVHPKYRASATIMPASQVTDRNPFPGASDLMNAARQFGVGLHSSDPSALFPAILASRSLADTLLSQSYTSEHGSPTSLLDRFKRGHASTRADMDRAYRWLTRHVLSCSFDKYSGTSAITALTDDPAISAQLANAAVHGLDRFNRALRSAQAGQHVQFVAGRLDEAEQELEKCEQALQTFREKNRDPSSPHLQLMEARLVRELGFSEQIFGTLRTEYELAKIEEVRNLPIIKVLDPAIPPLKPHSPHHLLIFVAFSFLGGSGYLLIALIRLRLHPPRRCGVLPS